MSNALDGFDIECMWDREPCLRVEVGATGDSGLDPGRVIPQEGLKRDEREFV